MKKNKISKNWVNKQRRDTYVRQSKVDGYRARSAYKLIEIDEKFKIFKGGMIIVDIGAAPGSWSQYAAKKVKSGKEAKIRKLQRAWLWTRTSTANTASFARQTILENKW